MVKLSTVNSELKKIGNIFLNKGKDYFYFTGDDVDPSVDGVYVCNINQLTLTQWISEALDRVKK